MIGPRVVRRLHDSGWEVAVLHRGVHHATQPPGVTEFRSPAAAIPVTTFPAETRAFASDVVLHMIAMGEADATAAMTWFAGHAGRIVVLSSGDVYRAYGRFIASEPGPPEPTPIKESAPVRDRLYPYRKSDTDPNALDYWYDKIIVERTVMAHAQLPATVLRLPKVYGPEEPANLVTVYGFREQPNWRWTHGFIDNVAAAIALAVTDGRAAGHIFNVGEGETPTMAERLARLPQLDVPATPNEGKDFRHDIAYDTTKIRTLLGFKEPVDERDAMREIALSWSRRK